VNLRITGRARDLADSHAGSWEMPRRSTAARSRLICAHDLRPVMAACVAEGSRIGANSSHMGPDCGTQEEQWLLGPARRPPKQLLATDELDVAVVDPDTRSSQPRLSLVGPTKAPISSVTSRLALPTWSKVIGGLI
jgi:hypothetical protein